MLERTAPSHPELQLAYTFYSPSAEHFAAGLNVDFRDYLPFDTTADARSALTALAPQALVFSKLDVWPQLTHEAAAGGVRLGLLSATLSAGSARSGRWASMLLHDAYAQLDAVGAIDTDDAEPPHRPWRSRIGYSNHWRHTLRPGLAARIAHRSRIAAARSPQQHAAHNCRRIYLARR